MKTSEFIKKWNETHLEFKASRLTDTAVEAISDGGRNIFQIDDGFLISGQRLFSTDEMILINGYLQTKPENRKGERKWVIPWGKDMDDGTQRAWSNSEHDNQLFMQNVSGLSGWKKNNDYQFTDSELENLKFTQSPAIAKAIDIAKEPIPDDQN